MSGKLSEAELKTARERHDLCVRYKAKHGMGMNPAEADRRSLLAHLDALTRERNEAVQTFETLNADRERLTRELESARDVAVETTGQLAAANQAREAAEKALAEIWGECCPDCGPQQYEHFAGLLSKMIEEQRQRAEAAEAAAVAMRACVEMCGEYVGGSTGTFREKYFDERKSSVERLDWVKAQIQSALATAPGSAANELRELKAFAERLRKCYRDPATDSDDVCQAVEKALAELDQALSQGEQRGEGT